MPYSTYTLDSVAIQTGILLDDPNELFYTRVEKYYAIIEALRVFGALTSYWRQIAPFSLTPYSPSPYYDLNQQLPTVRTRIWTLQSMVQEIQYHLLERASGVAGTGMSGQVSITSIIQAIQRARNQFVLDARLPLSVSSSFATPGTQAGLFSYDQSAVYVHRTSWQDALAGRWTTLWREDPWSQDHAFPYWTTEPGPPQAYSESELSPLQIQLYPANENPGTVEAIYVASLPGIQAAGDTFNVPDEWVWAVKYYALWVLFGSDSQISDPLRAQFCMQRYQQAMQVLVDARSVLRLLCNGVPLPIDTLMSLDAANPYWRNQIGRPNVAGALYDLIAISPGLADQAYSISADVAYPAPIPTAGAGSVPSNFVQIGDEYIPDIVSYAVSYLLLKCGGDEFKSSFDGYDSYMSSVAQRGKIDQAKIRYMGAFFGQGTKDQEQNPDQVPTGKGGR